MVVANYLSGSLNCFVLLTLQLHISSNVVLTRRCFSLIERDFVDCQKSSKMGTIWAVLLTSLFHWHVEGTGLSNFNLMKVKNDTWTTDYQRTLENRGPM